jgi:glutathione S-transferase
MKIYGDLGSGNCLKVKYAADLLGLTYTWVPIDIIRQQTRTPEFLAKFPMGQIPAVEFDDGRRLAQSNGIVRYLARGSALLPADPFVAAKIDELLFWEQYSHEPYLAVCRFHMVYLGRPKEAREPQRVERGEQALGLLDRLLAGRDWLVGESLTIADLVVLPYTRLAPEGGFDLAPHTCVRAWIQRCETALGLDGAPAHDLSLRSANDG